MWRGLVRWLFPWLQYSYGVDNWVCSPVDAEIIWRVIICAADPGGRAIYDGSLRPLACRDCGFESRQGHGCLFVVSVVCCQVEVSAKGRSFVQRSPTECDVSVMPKAQQWGSQCPLGLSSSEKIYLCGFNVIHIPCTWFIMQYVISQTVQSVINNNLSLMFLL